MDLKPLIEEQEDFARLLIKKAVRNVGQGGAVTTTREYALAASVAVDKLVSLLNAQQLISLREEQ